MDDDRFDLDDSTTENYQDLLSSIRKNMDPSNNSVLIIDDERGIRKMVARNIKAFDSGIQIYEAANGGEGLEALNKIRHKHTRPPLFIVLDLNMPIMNGWEFIKTLRKEYEDEGKNAGIPIIVLSSTSGKKGMLFMKDSVHHGKSGYTPLITIAKESCIDKAKYDAAGKSGLMAWIQHFANP